MRMAKSPADNTRDEKEPPPTAGPKPVCCDEPHTFDRTGVWQPHKPEYPAPPEPKRKTRRPNARTIRQLLLDGKAAFISEKLAVSWGLSTRRKGRPRDSKAVLDSLFQDQEDSLRCVRLILHLKAKRSGINESRTRLLDAIANGIAQRAKAKRLPKLPSGTLANGSPITWGWMVTRTHDVHEAVLTENKKPPRTEKTRPVGARIAETVTDLICRSLYRPFGLGASSEPIRKTRYRSRRRL